MIYFPNIFLFAQILPVLVCQGFLGIFSLFVFRYFMEFVVKVFSLITDNSFYIILTQLSVSFVIFMSLKPEEAQRTAEILLSDPTYLGEVSYNDYLSASDNTCLSDESID